MNNALVILFTTSCANKAFKMELKLRHLVVVYIIAQSITCVTGQSTADVA